MNSKVLHVSPLNLGGMFGAHSVGARVNNGLPVGSDATVNFELDLAMAQAQYHEAKLDIGGMGIGSYGALYEYGINDDMGINTRIAYFSTDNDNTYSTLTFTADFRYYFDAYEGGDGWFGTAYLKYRSLKSENYWGTTTSDNSGNRVYEDYNSGGIALGVTTGRKWIVNEQL